jgi:hypothetical protein
MANRSNGYFAPAKIQDFGIVLQIDGEAGYEQIVVQESNRRFALGKAFAGRKGKIVFCKTAEEMTYDERGQWDMSLPEDAVHAARLRRPTDYSVLDMY